MKRLAEICLPNVGEISFYGITSMTFAAVWKMLGNQAVHGLSVIFFAILAATTHHLCKYMWNKWLPIKRGNNE